MFGDGKLLPRVEMLYTEGKVGGGYEIELRGWVGLGSGDLDLGIQIDLWRFSSGAKKIRPGQDQMRCLVDGFMHQARQANSLFLTFIIARWCHFSR